MVLGLRGPLAVAVALSACSLGIFWPHWAPAFQGGRSSAHPAPRGQRFVWRNCSEVQLPARGQPQPQREGERLGGGRVACTPPPHGTRAPSRAPSPAWQPRGRPQGQGESYTLRKLRENEWPGQAYMRFHASQAGRGNRDPEKFCFLPSATSRKGQELGRAMPDQAHVFSLRPRRHILEF